MNLHVERRVEMHSLNSLSPVNGGGLIGQGAPIEHFLGKPIHFEPVRMNLKLAITTVHVDGCLDIASQRSRFPSGCVSLWRIG